VYAGVKLVYVALQVLIEVRAKLVRKGLVHNLMTLDSFSFSKHAFATSLEQFGFASRADAQNRGGILGFNNDRECLIGILSELAHFKHATTTIKLVIVQAIHKLTAMTNEAVNEAIGILQGFVMNDLDKLL